MLVRDGKTINYLVKLNKKNFLQMKIIKKNVLKK